MNLTNDASQMNDGPNVQKAAEGPIARKIETQTAKLPSDTFLWASLGSIVGSLTLRMMNRKNDAVFVGQWAPVFMLLGIYNKIVKVAGHDRAGDQNGSNCS